MSAIDRPSSQAFTNGARAFARLDTRPTAAKPVDPASREHVAVETVTLGKIGDFLELDFRRLFVWLRDGLVLMIILAVIGAAIGAAYATLAKPKFTVGTEILIDPDNLQVVANDLYQTPGQVAGQLLSAGTKLRVLTSNNVLLRVVDQLDLTNDPEFVAPADGGGFSLSSLFGGGAAVGEKPDPRVTALGALSKSIGTRTDDKSFVVTLLVSSQSAEKSIRISDAVVAAFKDELAKAEAEGAQRTAVALNERLEVLKQSVKLAEQKVEDYKRENGLSSSAGELVSTQTMSQLNTQVLEAQARVIAAEATYNEVVNAGRNASSSDPQLSASLAALRAKAADVRQALDSQSMVYGPRHPAIIKLRTEMQAVDAELGTETSRIATSAKLALDEAKAALAALSAKADTLKANVFSDNEALVTLRELERDATSKSTIYEAFLSRARQITEREQIDTTNIRVISTAVPPPARSWPPRTVMVMIAGAAAGFVLGLLLAIAFGIFRDMRRERSTPAAA